jgi:16S rRNA (guanine(966)-N(2))-methyltransferase RsmD
MFNVIGHSNDGARVLDGYAGTGAFGLEALSRGAEHVTFVEYDGHAIRVIERNIAACGAGEACVVLRAAFPGLHRRASRHAAVDLAVLDPPYDVPDLTASIAAAEPLMAPGGLLVLEHARRRQVPDEVGRLRKTRDLISGDSALAFYQL